MGLFINKVEQLIGNTGLTMERAVPKNQVQQLLNRLKPLQTDVELIRVGPQGDGGYLVPDDLNGLEACFSPGVDLISEFELECHKLGMKIFMADKSVDAPQIDLPKDQFDFKKKFVGSYNDETFITMDQWANESNISADGELLLQMDIEGAEYNTILNTSEAYLNRCRIIVMEIHDLHKLWNKFFFSIADTFFSKLLKNHTIVHLHPNNCCGEVKIQGIQIPRVMEFTFLRNDRINSANGTAPIPHPLDADNTANPTLGLSKDWL